MNWLGNCNFCCQPVMYMDKRSQITRANFVCFEQNVAKQWGNSIGWRELKMSNLSLAELTKKHCPIAEKRTTANSNTPHREHKEKTVFCRKCGLDIVGERMQLLTLPKKTSADPDSKHADCVSNERTIVLEFYKKERENELSIDEETHSPSTMGKKLKEPVMAPFRLPKQTQNWSDSTYDRRMSQNQITYTMESLSLKENKNGACDWSFERDAGRYITFVEAHGRSLREFLLKVIVKKKRGPLRARNKFVFFMWP